MRIECFSYFRFPTENSSFYAAVAHNNLPAEISFYLYGFRTTLIHFFVRNLLFQTINFDALLNSALLRRSLEFVLFSYCKDLDTLTLKLVINDWHFSILCYWKQTEQKYGIKGEEEERLHLEEQLSLSCLEVISVGVGERRT